MSGWEQLLLYSLPLDGGSYTLFQSVHTAQAWRNVHSTPSYMDVHYRCVHQHSLTPAICWAQFSGPTYSLTHRLLQLSYQCSLPPTYECHRAPWSVWVTSQPQIFHMGWLSIVPYSCLNQHRLESKTNEKIMACYLHSK